MNDISKAKILWRTTEGFRATFLIAIAAMGIGYLFMFGVPWVTRLAIDEILDLDGYSSPAWLVTGLTALSGGDTPGLMTYLLAAAAATVILTVIFGALVYVRGRCMAVASEGIVRRLRETLFTHLEHLPSRFHDRADTGDLVQRCTSDLETVRVFLSGQVIEISRAILMLLVVTPILFSMDTRMAWLSLVIMPPLTIAAFLFFGRVKNLFTVVDESEAEMTTVLQENLTGIRVVRAFARQEFEIDKFAVKAGQFRDNNKKLMASLGLYYSFSDIVCLGQIGLLLLVGATWVIDGSLTIGTLFAFITYESMIIWPIRHMGRVLTDSGKAIVAIGRISEILSEPAESEGALNPGHRIDGSVEFDQVHFAFDPGNPVLSSVSFRIEPGQTLAILGPPGGGKSTIAQLLLRLYDYEEGKVLLGGFPLNEMNRKFVRSQISIVLQEPFLFSATIAENLSIGRVDATREEIVQATTDACIHDSILTFPNGYDSHVGERGVTLSGGQRQRIALARALLKDPPILILDDSLSAVDTDTEARILAALKKRRRDSTTIIIAHRLSSVMHADKIIVLGDGSVAQEGTHDSLRQVQGSYQQLCEIQGAIQQQIEQDTHHV